MGLDESVTVWIERLRDGNEHSVQQLWEHYFQELVRLARKKLPANVRRAFDEEDVALSAFHSLCRGVQNDRFPRLEDRDNLWSLLVVITARKAMRRVRDETAQKRGGGRVSGESVFLRGGGSELSTGINQIIGDQPTPEFAADVSEESERLLAQLPDEDMRRLAVLKLEGYSNAEAAKALGCGLRTVERRLGLIRRLWVVRDESS
jgi:DNA-directed RNA polymerase specialized sigma24 family protein